MTQGWHRRFMRPAYWPIADWEYTAARTAREVAYLTARLPEPGSVLDAGCGLGRHASALAGLGWSVIGVDCRVDVLAEARRRGLAGPGAPRFACADLFRGVPVRPASMDAAICLQAFGWGSEADQRALLGHLRDALRRGGTLILDVTNPAWILGHYAPRAQAEIDGATRVFERGYDVATGRSRGVTSGPDGPIEHDIRLYTPPEVERLLCEAGFDMVAVDADFEAGASLSLDTRYTQYVARRQRLTPASFVTAGASGPAAAGGRTAPVHLDLRWIVEEPAAQQAGLDDLVARVAERLGVDGARDYHLDDPYGSARLGPALGLPPDSVTAGAGVSSLLAALGAAAAGAPVTTTRQGHPDLPYFAALRGSPVRVVTAPGDLDIPPGGLVCLDRPASDGTVVPLDTLRALAGACAERGALLVIDESYASYLDPGERVAPWAARTGSVVALGGLSKGYGLGGLRVGWAVATPDTTARLRRYIPALQASALSVAVAAEVLADPARLDPLWALVRGNKPRFVALLTAAGVQVHAGHPAVPWVLVPAPHAARLADLGVAGKPCAAVDDAHWRFVVPLSDARWASAVALLRPARPGAPASARPTAPAPARPADPS